MLGVRWVGLTAKGKVYTVGAYLLAERKHSKQPFMLFWGQGGEGGKLFDCSFYFSSFYGKFLFSFSGGDFDFLMEGQCSIINVCSRDRNSLIDDVGGID